MDAKPRVRRGKGRWRPIVQEWGCAYCGYQYWVEQAYAVLRRWQYRASACERCPRCGTYKSVMRVR